MALEVVSKRVIGSQLWILKKSIMAIVLGVDQSKVRLAGEGRKAKTWKYREESSSCRLGQG